jgi:hypothetical protein
MAEGNLHYYGRPLKRNPAQSSNITISSASQTYGEESAVGNLGGVNAFCIYCHWMLPFLYLLPLDASDE